MILKVKRLHGFAKVKGLIGEKSRKPIYFQTRFGIHTFGVRFPVDVVILDNKNRVVKLKQNLEPYRLFFWNPIYNQVLELPEGIIKKKNIQLGQQIRLVY